MSRWRSLWNGPLVEDSVENDTKYGHSYSLWRSVGLYALDMEDRAWTFCVRDGGHGKWIRFEDLMSNAAGRQTVAEWKAEKEPDGT